MSDTNTIITIKDYGKIIFKFNEIMDSRNISRNKLASSAGIRFEVADRFYKGNIERMDIDVLTKICYVLDCKIEDVMEYQKP